MQKYVFSSKIKFFFQKNTRPSSRATRTCAITKKKRIPNGTLLLCIDFFATSTFRKIHVLFAKLMVGLQKYIRKIRVRKTMYITYLPQHVSTYNEGKRGCHAQGSSTRSTGACDITKKRESLTELSYYA